MKKFRRVLGLLLALVMAMSMGISAMAATITVSSSGVSGATYTAYKLMDVTVGEDTSGNKTYAYTVNATYRDIIASALNLSSTTYTTDEAMDAAIISTLAKYQTDNSSAAVRTFADTVYKAIASGLDAKTLTLTPDTDYYVTTVNSFTVAEGYYLVAETVPGTTSTSGGNTNTVYSLAMLNTATDDEPTTVYTKEDVPTVEKKVKEVNDSEFNSTTDWQDAADYDIGDSVPFRLRATLPNYYSNYTEYSVTFHDTLSSGLTFDASTSGDTALVVNIVNGNSSVTLSSSYYTVTTTNLTDGCNLEISFSDLKSIPGVTIQAGTIIEVLYYATLNEDAKIGSAGNPNTVYLEYSNNPYDTNSTGKTPEDKVTVFTYQLVVGKVDSSRNPLAGAEFTLYKYYATTASTGEWKPITTGYTKTSDTAFTWTGLDEGEYRIVETTVPDGYTKAADIEFKITSTYSTDSDDPQLRELVVTITSGEGSVVGEAGTAVVSTGLVSMSVINTTGSEMPTTGGIGTTIFYIVGSLLALGAAVLLVTKRRMGRAQ